MSATIAGAVLTVLCLSAAPPPPVVPADVQRIVYIPRPDGVIENAAAFLRTTASDSAILSDKTVQRLLDSALPPGASILNLQSLRDAGIDTARNLTIFQRDGIWVACYSVSNGKKKEGGGIQREYEGSEQLVDVSQRDGQFLLQGKASQAGGIWLQGSIALHGRMCTAKSQGNNDVRDALTAAKTVLLPSPGKKFSPLAKAIADNRHYTSGSHVLFATPLTGDDIVSISAEPEAASPSLKIQGFLQGKTAKFLAPPPARREVSPLPVPDIPLWIELSLSTEALSRTGDIASSIQRVLRHGIPALPAEQRESLKREILSSMTGSAAVAISGINKKYSKGNMHQIGQAVFAQIRQPEKLAPLLALAADKLSASGSSSTETPATSLGYTARIDGGDVWFGIEGSTLYFSNRKFLAERALSTPPPSGFQPSKAEPASLRIFIDGREAAEALRPISMFDIADGQLFAKLFALKMDFSGLLKKSNRTALTAVFRGGKLSFQTIVDLSGRCRPCEAARQGKR